MKKRNWLLWVVLLAGLVACKGTDGENGRPRVEQVAAGVWKLTSGTPEKLNLLSELHVRPKVEAINAMAITGYQEDVEEDMEDSEDVVDATEEISTSEE